MTKLKNIGLFALIFVVVHAGSRLSLLAHRDLLVSDFYLPTAIGIIIIHWFGPRMILPILFINGVSTCVLWGIPIENWPLWFLYAIPETLYVFLSWFFFRILYKGKYWLPDIHHTVKFLIVGILIPAIVETLLLPSMLVWTGAQSPDAFQLDVANNLLSEFASTFFLTLPVLYYVSPVLQRKNLIKTSEKIPLPPILSFPRVLELTVVFICLFGLIFILGFKKYWYIYGFFSLFVAIRHGFGPAILTNFYILLLTYVAPKFFDGFGINDADNLTYVTEVFPGANFLFVFIAVTGRVISDIKNAEATLIRKNAELEKTNAELDQFVYSVSHDLSAPLKSILGLVNTVVLLMMK